jgi:hypothetical protein
MRRFTTTVFEDFVVGATSTSPVYTATDFNKTLGSVDRLAFQVVADQVSGTTPTFTLQIEHSGDGRNWLSKAGTPEVNAQGLSTSAASVFIAYDAGTTPSLGFIRFKIFLAGTSPVAHVKVHVTGRDNGG